MQSIRPKIYRVGITAHFSLLEVYLNKKGLSVKTQLPHIFKDHHIVAKPNPTAVGSD